MRPGEVNPVKICQGAFDHLIADEHAGDTRGIEVGEIGHSFQARKIVCGDIVDGPGGRCKRGSLVFDGSSSRVERCRDLIHPFDGVVGRLQSRNDRGGIAELRGLDGADARLNIREAVLRSRKVRHGRIPLL